MAGPWTVDSVSYNRRKKITIDGDTYISGNLTDQAVAVNIDSGETDFWAEAPTNGDEVRFTKSDGSTLCKFQVESFDATGDDAWFHVKIPTLSSSVDTDIYMYYDPDTPSDGEDKENVWDASYDGVWHFNEDQAEGAFDDATSNNINGTNSGSTNETGAKIDNGRSFVTNDSISLGDVLEFGSSSVVVEGWIDLNSHTTNQGFMGKYQSTGTLRAWFFYCQGGELKFLTSYNGSSLKSTVTTGTPISIDTTYHIAVVKNGTGVTFYVNGSVAADDGAAVDATIFNNTEPVYFGKLSSSYLNGWMDEFTISIGTTRSADWIEARYQSGLGTWLTVAAEEGPTADTEVSATTDALALTEQAADVNLNKSVAATTDALALTEYGATVNAETSISATTDALALTEYGATVNSGKNIVATTDVLALTEQAADVTLDKSVVATTDALALTEQAATVNAERSIAAGKDTLSLTTYQATVSVVNDTNVSAATDALTLAEKAATITLPVNVSAGVVALSLATYDATITRPFVRNKYIQKAIQEDSSLARPQKAVIQ